MNCPACQHPKNDCIDSRPTHEGAARRRRRKCQQCEHQWTTYEIHANRLQEFEHLDKLAHAATLLELSAEPLDRACEIIRGMITKI